MQKYDEIVSVLMAILVVTIVSIFTFVETIHWLVRWVL
jgi:hypothetical protein